MGDVGGVTLEASLIRLNRVMDCDMDHGEVQERRRASRTSTGEDRIRRDGVQLADRVGSRRRAQNACSREREHTDDQPGNVRFEQVVFHRWSLCYISPWR